MTSRLFPASAPTSGGTVVDSVLVDMATLQLKRRTVTQAPNRIEVVKDSRKVAKIVGVRPQLQGATLTSELLK